MIHLACVASCLNYSFPSLPMSTFIRDTIMALITTRTRMIQNAAPVKKSMFASFRENILVKELFIILLLKSIFAYYVPSKFAKNLN
jgi:hypothetical protein